jgi:hypothetical protein
MNKDRGSWIVDRDGTCGAQDVGSTIGGAYWPSAQERVSIMMSDGAPQYCCEYSKYQFNLSIIHEAPSALCKWV